MKPALCFRSVLCAGALAAAVTAAPAAEACGGFFCSVAQPVNQAAERIIFAENGDGTVTAVIQILYEGPAENFSWLLPISSVPSTDQIGVASNLAFTRLQSATNPQYNLTTRVEGTCRSDVLAPGTSTGGSTGSGGSAGSGPNSGDGVTVEASGTIGAFNYEVISVAPMLSDPAATAVAWLEEHGYDVSPGSPELLGPYLEDGNYLLALRLVKGSDTGSIRPLRITYRADQPLIPIKLTAVAANEDMGVMTWLLSDGRGVPQNYLSLELNEARINWFNAATNYNDVVIAAADDAGGQGFVTEFAGPTTAVAQSVWTDSDESIWSSFQGTQFQNFQQLFDSAFGQWGTWDGFWDAVRETVTLPADVPFADFKLCPNCYSDRVTFSPSAFMAELDEQVMAPVRDVQELLDAHPYVTRLYTTMSAAEMTSDPVFTFNETLDDVSNVHSAERVIECSSTVSQFEAPWRIELPQGGVIRGNGSNTAWPQAVDEQPPNFRILRLAASGPGEVLEDNAASILTSLDAYNSGLGAAGSGGTGTGGRGGSGSGGDAGSGAEAGDDETPSVEGSGGCALGGSPAHSGWLLGLGGALALFLGRRRAAKGGEVQS